MTVNRARDAYATYLDEYLFDGQFVGLIEPEVIVKHYLGTMDQRKVTPVLAGKGRNAFFCSFQPQEWDAEQLGKRVGRIEYISANCRREEQLRLIESVLTGFELAYLRLSRRHPLTSLIQAGGSGFRPYADKVMFRLAIDPVAESPPGSHLCRFGDLEIPDKEQQLLKIAEESFTINRFSRDETFPADFNDRVYRSWVSGFMASGQNVICSIRRNQLSGFIVVSDTTGTPLERFNCGFVELIAVARNAKRRTIGRELLQKAAATLLENQIRILHANTDSQNTGAIRFFKAAGFKQFNSIREYHWWRP